MTNKKDDQYISANDLAARWSVHVNTVRNMIKRGDLKSIFFGNNRRVPLSEVERFEKEHKEA